MRRVYWEVQFIDLGWLQNTYCSVLTACKNGYRTEVFKNYNSSVSEAIICYVLKEGMDAIESYKVSFMDVTWSLAVYQSFF